MKSKYSIISEENVSSLLLLMGLSKGRIKIIKIYKDNKFKRILRYFNINIPYKGIKIKQI